MKFTEIISKIYQSNVDLYRRLKEQSQIHKQARETDVTNLYEKVHAEAAPCFVLSTGRCGTKLLTNILQTNSGIDAQHVPTPELTYYSEFAYKNAETKSETISRIIDAARYEQIRDAFLLDKKFVETNHRITFFGHALAGLFPNARFVHLVRKPEEFITSGLARNWYSGGNLHDEGRIAPEDQQLNQAQKIAWLWNETNAFIEDFKQEISEDRVHTVRSEELFRSVQATIKIFHFLELESPSKTKIKQIIRKPVNKQSKTQIPDDAVTSELLERFAPLQSRYFD